MTKSDQKLFQELDMTDYANKMARMMAMVSATNDIRAKSDLYKVYRNCKDIYTELNKESVNCRRLHKITATYQEIQTKLDESINIFEQWVTFAALLYT